MLETALFLNAPYNRFKDFISPEANRFDVLCSIFDECLLPWEVLEIEGKRHIAVPAGLSVGRINSRFTQESRYPQGSLTEGLIFTAHYDRVPQSPGANDNSAAVFQLLETATRIAARGSTGRPVLFIFTDGEELAAGQSLKRQGSYSLGLYLKKNGLGNSHIFTFDASGTGDTLIISTAADHLLKNETSAGAEAARRNVQLLRQKALAAARTARLEKTLLLPTPFSEDAGFLLAGMAAQTITTLPQNEASLVRGDAAFLRKTALQNTDRRLVPETWRILNGPGDSPLRLTPEHWKKVSAFAEALTE